MVELERTFDPVRLSAIKALLAEADIEAFAFDQGAGGLWTGAIPVRVMVHEADLELAKMTLRQAGLWDSP